MLNNKNKLLGFCLFSCISTALQADVLVILPESGPLARAGLSIKQGIQAAYQAEGNTEPLKFVNSDQIKIATLLKRNVTKRTKLIIGPLARNDVDALLKTKPKIQVLALNEGGGIHQNVVQFALSKTGDVLALQKLLRKDKLKALYVYRQDGNEVDHELFLMSLMTYVDYPVTVVDELPKKIKRSEGLLLLGDNTWLRQVEGLPKKHLYTVATAVEYGKSLPLGIQYCDIPAVYSTKWPDILSAIKSQPNLQYQRLVAFGGDAWQIASLMLKADQSNIQFDGRTGIISLQDTLVQRVPTCYRMQKRGLEILK